MPQNKRTGDSFDLREFPFLVAQRADGARFEPTLYAVKMKHMATAAEGNREAVFVVRRWVGLVLDRWLI